MISLVLLVIFTQKALPLSLHFYSIPIEATLYLLTKTILYFWNLKRLNVWYSFLLWVKWRHIFAWRKSVYGWQPYRSIYAKYLHFLPLCFKLNINKVWEKRNWKKLTIFCHLKSGIVLKVRRFVYKRWVFSCRGSGCSTVTFCFSFKIFMF